MKLKFAKIREKVGRGWFSLPSSLVHSKQRHINASLHGTAGGTYANDLNMISILPKHKFKKLPAVKDFMKNNSNTKLFGITLLRPEGMEINILDRGQKLNAKTLNHELTEKRIYDNLNANLPEIAHGLNPVKLNAKGNLKSIIEREFKRVTGKDKIHIELDNHTLINKSRIEKSIGDKIKIGDIITEYTVDDGKPLLEKKYSKEWVVNRYPEIANKDKIYKSLSAKRRHLSVPLDIIKTLDPTERNALTAKKDVPFTETYKGINFKNVNIKKVKKANFGLIPPESLNKDEHKYYMTFLTAKLTGKNAGIFSISKDSRGVRVTKIKDVVNLVRGGHPQFVRIGRGLQRIKVSTKKIKEYHNSYWDNFSGKFGSKNARNYGHIPVYVGVPKSLPSKEGYWDANVFFVPKNEIRKYLIGGMT